MRGEVGRWVLRCVSAVVILLCLPVANSAADSLARSTAESVGRAQYGWLLSVRGGLLRSAGVYARGNHGTRSENAVAAGLSHSAGPKLAFEVACMLSARARGPLRLSMAQGKLRMLFYPSARRVQRDQLFFLVGAEFLVADDEEHTGRFGGGPEVGMGLDYAVGKTTIISIEASLAYVGLASGNAANVYSPPPPGSETVIRDKTSAGGIAQLMLGFRFAQ